MTSAVTGCVSISECASLVDIPAEITSSTATIKICVITAGIKKYMSIIKGKRKNYDKILFIGKDKFNAIKV